MTTTLPDGWTEHRFETIGSTMDAARDLALHACAADRTVVRADTQSGGRGRHGRTWTSESGNLYITMLLRESAALSDCAQLSFAAALALYDAINLPDVALKWPNDVLIGGKKTAGILLEAGGKGDQQWLLIGIGVNIAHHPTDTPYPVTHLVAEGGAASADAVFARLLERIDHWRDVWHKQGAAALHSAWWERAYGRGEKIRVQLPDREITGRLEALNAAGALVVVTDSGTRHCISAGDVFFA